jgi:hypothetical protein
MCCFKVRAEALNQPNARGDGLPLTAANTILSQMTIKSSGG